MSLHPTFQTILDGAVRANAVHEDAATEPLPHPGSGDLLADPSTMLAWRVFNPLGAMVAGFLSLVDAIAFIERERWDMRLTYGQQEITSVPLTFDAAHRHVYGAPQSETAVAQ